MTTAAQSAKERVIELVEDLPDDSSYDEILRELVFARMWIVASPTQKAVGPSATRR